MRFQKMMLPAFIVCLTSLVAVAQVSKRDPKKEPLLVTVTDTGKIYVLSTEVSVEQLGTRLKEEAVLPHESVFFRAHGSLEMGKVGRVLGAIKSTGLPVSVVTYEQEVPKRKQFDSDKIAGALNFSGIIRECVLANWNFPYGLEKAQEQTITMRLLLKPDGRLVRSPVVKDDWAGRGSTFFIVKDRAVRAVLTCEPFNLPVDKYDQWKDIQITLEAPKEQTSPADRQPVESPRPKRNTEKITALLNKPPAPDNQMRARDIALISKTVHRCIHEKWTSSAGLENSEGMVVNLELQLDERGRLTLPPRVVHDGKPQYMTYFTMAHRAVKAATDCQPFALPGDTYDLWKQVRLTLEWPGKSQ